MSALRNIFLIGLALSAGASEVRAEAAPAAAAGPVLAQCRVAKTAPASERQRTRPIPIPPAFASIARSNVNRIAVLTLTGATLCVDVSDVEVIDHIAMSRDNRFFGYNWGAIEAGGHTLIDRSGNGHEYETGASLSFSPSRGRIASIEISESGFGALNGFLVLQVNPVGLRELARLNDIPVLSDWKIESWVGENCINLSGITNEDYPVKESEVSRAPRQHYVARPVGKTWRLTRVTDRGCPPV